MNEHEWESLTAQWTAQIKALQKQLADQQARLEILEKSATPPGASPAMASPAPGTVTDPQKGPLTSRSANAQPDSQTGFVPGSQSDIVPLPETQTLPQPTWTPQATLEAALLPLAHELSADYDFAPGVQHPADLEGHKALLTGARLLEQSQLSDMALLRYLHGGEHVMFGLMAAQALRMRGANVFDALIPMLPELEERGLHFALQLLQAHARQDAVEAVLGQASVWWARNDVVCRSLDRFLDVAYEQFGTLLPGLGMSRGMQLRRESLLALCDALTTSHAVQLQQMLLRKSGGALPALPDGQDTSQALLAQIGRLWEAQSYPSLIVPHTHLLDVVDQMESLLTGPSRRSVVLSGKHGVGKSVAIHLLSERLEARGWQIFEASAADVLAGQRYLGELESRVGQLLAALQAPKQIVWYIPDFHELLDKGATQQDPTGILDLVLPALERRQVVVVGETQPESYARLQRARHKLRYCLQTITMESADLESSIALARDWADALSEKMGRPIVASGTLEEAVQLSLQFFADRALPGSIMQLLQLSQLQRENTPAEQQEQQEQSITVEDLLKTIAQLTHLPASVLDDRERLEIESLREHFRRHVIGQEEAVECLVDRIAMIKAGLTDPSRPLGVFLFAGPTGTGKTELAKTLCRFLFGSENNMIRLDMSEYNDRDSYWRLIQEGDGVHQARSLASQIREQPFSVVLLDEVEKAHPQIWDLFLQVFDDGRLTDRSGNTADFRHSIMILTSNVGSTIPRGSGVGFTAKEDAFVPEAVNKAIAQTFRREFLNRIDRVVVFHPLRRAVMRDILHKELNGLLQRRGFRSKDWAVEWGASAVDFLLEQGFTPDLGARPLKRAIERYLLAPLAKTIVEHRFPEGNQFLFVSSDESRIQVQFIDPDVKEQPAAQVDPAAQAPIRLKGIAYEPTGRADEIACIEEHWQSLSALRKGEVWRSEKHETQLRMNAEDFLHARDRYQILETIEVIDRIEAGIEAAGAALRRLAANHDLSAHTEPLRRLALQVVLLEIAAKDVLRHMPHNALVHIVGLPSPELPREATLDVFQHVRRMYQGWAEGRRMRSMWLRRGRLDAMQAVLAVSGLAALSILSNEQGLHIFELPREDGTFHLTRVRVRVCPQPVSRPSSNQSILSYATDLFSQEESSSNTICRHYRWAPSPLVRDHIVHWRTHEIARVLAGDFDLFEA